MSTDPYSVKLRSARELNLDGITQNFIDITRCPICNGALVPDRWHTARCSYNCTFFDLTINRPANGVTA